MAYSLKYRITSQYPCQIPVVGEFAAGETKDLSDYTVGQFLAQYGYPIGKGLFPHWVTLEVVLDNDEPETTEDESPEEETVTEEVEEDVEAEEEPAAEDVEQPKVVEEESDNSDTEVEEA